MSTAEVSERISERLLAAFLVGAAGPLTGLLAVLLLPFPTTTAPATSWTCRS